MCVYVYKYVLRCVCGCLCVAPLLECVIPQCTVFVVAQGGGLNEVLQCSGAYSHMAPVCVCVCLSVCVYQSVTCTEKTDLSSMVYADMNVQQQFSSFNNINALVVWVFRNTLL